MDTISNVQISESKNPQYVNANEISLDFHKHVYNFEQHAMSSLRHV